MASRVKEDEKNERIIRGLLKLPENRRCINCNNLGPQYVCTSFWTFVCTPCSGIHREFTHRVKSVSMAKFTSQEVKALQEGGNQRTKEIYLKEWDPQRNSLPDSSNVERLRDFIKHVYVDRRYTGEKNSDKPPRSKTGEKDESYENKRAPSYQGGSRSPPYEDSEQRYSGRSSPGARSYDGGRSLGYDQDSRQNNDYRKSPARPEVVNDWRREDRFGNGRKNDDRRMSDGDSKMEGRSPDRPKNVGSASPPVVRPVREILGENTIPLRVIEPPKPAVRSADGSAHTQRSASSSSLASANGNPVEVKSEPSGSLIDFDADAEPPVAAPPQQTSTVKPTSQPESSATDNWASFDMSPQVKVPEAPTLALDSLLSQLSVSAPVPAHNYGAPGANAPPAVSVNNLSTFPLDGMSVVAPGSASASVFPVNTGNTAVNAPGATQWLNATQQQHQQQQQQQQHQHQQQPSFFSAAGNQPSSQQFTQPAMGGTSNTQPWNAVPALNAHGFPSNLTQMVHPTAVRPVHEVHSSAASQLPVTDVKLSGRTALPEDLFASNYSNFRAPVPGWQTGPPGGMGGYGMPYNMGMSGQAYQQQPFQPVQAFQQQPFQPVQAFQQQRFQAVQAFQQPSKSTNPFDLTSETPAQAPPTACDAIGCFQFTLFPSMGSLESALPNAMNPSGLMRTGSLGTPSSPWMAQPQPQQHPSFSFSSLLPPQVPPAYPSALPPRAYMDQQAPNNMLPPGHQQGENSGFSSFNMEQQLPGRFSAPATPSPFSSSGGNPFG